MEQELSNELFICGGCNAKIGPGVLGKALPELHAAVFTAPVITALNGVAWWAVMLFVMIAGIELDIRKAWENRRETGVTAGLAHGAAMGFLGHFRRHSCCG